MKLLDVARDQLVEVGVSRRLALSQAPNRRGHSEANGDRAKRLVHCLLMEAGRPMASARSRRLRRAAQALSPDTRCGCLVMTS